MCTYTALITGRLEPVHVLVYFSGAYQVLIALTRFVRAPDVAEISVSVASMSHSHWGYSVAAAYIWDRQ